MNFSGTTVAKTSRLAWPASSYCRVRGPRQAITHDAMSGMLITWNSRPTWCFVKGGDRERLARAGAAAGCSVEAAAAREESSAPPRGATSARRAFVLSIGLLASVALLPLFDSPAALHASRRNRSDLLAPVGVSEVATLLGLSAVAAGPEPDSWPAPSAADTEEVGCGVGGGGGVVAVAGDGARGERALVGRPMMCERAYRDLNR